MPATIEPMKALENIWEVEMTLDGTTVFDKLLVSTDERDINAAIAKAERYVKETYPDPNDKDDQAFASAQAITVKLTGHTIIL